MYVYTTPLKVSKNLTCVTGFRMHLCNTPHIRQEGSIQDRTLPKYLTM